MTSRRNKILASIALAVALLVAACTPPNSAPTVTIQSPTDGATSFSPVVLSATASDAQDGELTTAITWTSDVDGTLTPAGNGEVALSLGAHVITASASDSAGLSGSASVSIEVVTPKATHAVAEGLNVHLLYIEEGALVEADSASIPAADLLPQHAIFNVIKHPTEPWLYAASANDCGGGTVACWGNGRIDRFVIENDSIRHDGAAFLYDLDAVDVTCAQAPVDPAYDGQVGWCAPNGMVFSPDGKRFYVDDDDLDGIHIFAVDGAGDLTFLAEGGTTSAHGLTIDASGDYLYNGSSVISVAGDVAADVFAGAYGNATAIVDVGGTARLISTVLTSDVAAYDLIDPLAPNLIDTLALGSDLARDLEMSSTGGVVVVGKNSVRTALFDGTAFTALDTYTAAEAFTTQYRGVALSADGTSAIAAWFQRLAEDTFSGGAQLFAIADDGVLTKIDAVEYGGRGTTVLRVR